MQGAVRPAATGVWQAPVNLSIDGQNADTPQVAADPQGDAVAVWESYGSYTVVQGAVRPAATGVWEAPGSYRDARQLHAQHRRRHALHRPARHHWALRRRTLRQSDPQQPRAQALHPFRGAVRQLHPHPAGRADRFKFTGRLAGHALKPGRYRLVATPTARGRTGKPSRAGLRIVK